MKILVILLFTSLSTCGQQRTEYFINPKAKLLSDSAASYFSSHGNKGLQTTISLLKQATRIDSNFIQGFNSTLQYELMARDFKAALQTAKRINSLRPENADYLSLVGLMYELNLDTITSKNYFKKAIDIYRKVIDTIDLKTEKAIQSKFNLALNYLYLNQNITGQKLLIEALANSKNEIQNEYYIQYYLNKTGKEIITNILNKYKQD